MLNIEIYKDNAKVTNIQFQKQFMILIASGELFWDVDGKRSSPVKGGEIHIWIRLEENNKYKLVFVRDDWSLIIDRQRYPSRFYEDIEITHQHTFELEFKPYRFVSIGNRV